MHFVCDLVAWKDKKNKSEQSTGICNRSYVFPTTHVSYRIEPTVVTKMIHPKV